MGVIPSITPLCIMAVLKPDWMIGPDDLLAYCGKCGEEVLPTELDKTYGMEGYAWHPEECPKCGEPKPYLFKEELDWVNRRYSNVD